MKPETKKQLEKRMQQEIERLEDRIKNLKDQRDKQHEQIRDLNKEVDGLNNQKREANSKAYFEQTERVTIFHLMLLQPHDYQLARRCYDLEGTSGGNAYVANCNDNYRPRAVNESAIAARVATLRQQRPYLFKV